MYSGPSVSSVSTAPGVPRANRCNTSRPPAPDLNTPPMTWLAPQLTISLWDCEENGDQNFNGGGFAPEPDSKCART